MNSLCSTGSGMSGLTSSVISGLPAPTGFTVTNSIAIPLDSDPDLILHYPLNSSILDYTGTNPTTGINDAVYAGDTAYIGLSSSQSIFKNGKSLFKTLAGNGNSDNFLRMDNSNILFTANTKGYSFSFWFYQTSNSGMIWSICRDSSLYNTSNNNQNKYGMYYTIGAQGLQLIAVPAGSGAVQVTKTFLANPVSNQWYHVAWTLNTSSQSNVYVNGTQVLTNDTTIPYFSVDMKNKYLFGDTNVSSTIYGYMNDFRYYNRVLNIYEIKQLFNISIPLNNDSALVLYYPFNYDYLNYASGSGVGVTNGTPNSTLIQSTRFKFGKGALFSNNSEFNNISFPSNSGNISISFWVYYNGSFKIGGSSMIDFGGIGTNIKFTMYSTNGTTGPLYIGVYATNGYFENTVLSSISPNTWYHIVLTMDVTNKRYSVYVNNVVRLNNFGTGSITSFTPMSSTNSTFNQFSTTGYFEDFRYYSRLLSVGEIAQLYNFNTYTNLNTILNLNTDPSLCLYYTFDLSTNTVSNYAQNVYGTVDASYVNGASVNFTDSTFIGVGALKLSATNSRYVQLLPTSVVNTTNFISNNGMTFACFFYSIDSNNNAPIFDFGTDTGDDIILSIFNNQILCKMLNTGTFYSLSSLATYNNSTRHVVWTMSYSAAETSTWNLYIDASRVNTISTNKYPLQVARNKNYLGKSNYVSDPFFNGYIDDFRVYQRVLTQTEINQLYTYTNTLNVKSGNLSWTAANTTKTPLTYNYFYKDNSLNITSTPVNTSSTNTVINNLIDGNNITFSVNSQVDTKQSKYVSVTK